MNESRARIERIRRINQHNMYLEVAIENEALHNLKPGESLLVRLADDDAQESWHPYLREQWFPAGFTANNLLLVELPFSHRYQPQQVLDVLGPIGLPYRFRKSLRSVLLVAYDTPPTPLTIMIGQLLHHKVSVTLVLLGSARSYQTDHLPPEIEVIHGDDKLDWHEQVMTLGWADQIFVVAAQDAELTRFADVLKMVEEKRNTLPDNYIFGVFQPLLPCGTGGCSACMLHVDRVLTPVCTRGPAFDLKTVKLPK